MMRLFEIAFNAVEIFNLASQANFKGSRVMVLAKSSGQ